MKTAIMCSIGSCKKPSFTTFDRNKGMCEFHWNEYNWGNKFAREYDSKQKQAAKILKNSSDSRS